MFPDGRPTSPAGKLTLPLGGTAINEQRQRHQAERKQLTTTQRDHRRELLMETDWQGKGPLRNAWQTIIAAEQAAAKAVLAERQARERHELRQRFRPYPDLEQWHRQQKNPRLAQQWRYRDHELPGMEGEGDDRPRPRAIADYAYSIQGREVHYSRKTSPPET